MMTTRRFIGIALAGCMAFVCLPMRLLDVAVATWREYEPQAVAMARLELTLAKWRESLDAAFSSIRPDMRASGHGLVFNDMPSQFKPHSAH